MLDRVLKELNILITHRKMLFNFEYNLLHTCKSSYPNILFEYVAHLNFILSYVTHNLMLLQLLQVIWHILCNICMIIEWYTI